MIKPRCRGSPNAPVFKPAESVFARSASRTSAGDSTEKVRYVIEEVALHPWKGLSIKRGNKTRVCFPLSPGSRLPRTCLRTASPGQIW